MGGGISVSAHCKGRVIDTNNAQLFLHPAVAACKTDLGFQLFQGGLAMFDGIPCALTGDPEVFPDLTEGEVK